MDSKSRPAPKYAKVNMLTFWIAVVAITIFYGSMVILKEELIGPFQKLLKITTYTTDWMWQLVVFGSLIFLLWLSFSRYGKIKLGAPDEKPEFSTFTWMAMMFCGGIGAGLVYWSILEPLYYLAYPPFWAEPLSAQAAQWSLSYSFFHWGFSAWATYGIPAVAFSYMYYVRKKPYLYASYACRGVLGNRVDGWLGKLIDAVIVIGILGGTATSLGFVIPMLSQVSADYFGIQESIGYTLMIAVVFLCIYGYSTYNGLYSGLSKLSNFNMYLTFAILIFLFAVGPGIFSLSLFSDSFGVLLNNYFRMSFYTDPITKSGFPQDWTVFYWAWWIAWAVYIGLYAARISKGRTIRALVLNMIFTASIATFVIITVFGSYQIDVLFNQGVDLVKILTEQDGPAVISYFINNAPYSFILAPFFLIVMAVSQATGVDAAAYTIANMTCCEVRYGVEPPRWNRVFWALMVFFATVGLLFVGAMEVAKLSTVITVIPTLFVMVILAISLVKWIREDVPDDPAIYITKYIDNEPDSTFEENVTKTQGYKL